MESKVCLVILDLIAMTHIPGNHPPRTPRAHRNSPGPTYRQKAQREEREEAQDPQTSQRPNTA